MTELKNNMSAIGERYAGGAPNKNSNKKIFFIAVAAILGFFLYSWNAGKNGTQSAATGAPASVSVVPAITQDMPNIVSLVGTVYAFETVAIKSRLDSQITSVHFKDGDTVKEGAILFKLDNSVINAELNQNEANLKRDEAQLDNARAQYARYQNLAKKGYASKEKMEEALAAFKTQEAAVNATKASLQSIKAQLNFTTIKAPITGRAGTINVTRGNNVKANDATALVTINRVKPIRVQFAIPQRYYDALREASKGVVEVTSTRSDGQNASVGKLEYIDNNIDSATGSFIARAVFENIDEKLWPGMFVNVSITLNVDKDALVIPQVALQNGQDETFVYITDNERKKSIKRKVEVVRTQDNKAIIKNGIVAGDNVIVDGLLKVSDGGLIDISTPTPEGAEKPKEK